MCAYHFAASGEISAKYFMLAAKQKLVQNEISEHVFLLNFTALSVIKMHVQPVRQHTKCVFLYRPLLIWIKQDKILFFVIVIQKWESSVHTPKIDQDKSLAVTIPYEVCPSALILIIFGQPWNDIRIKITSSVVKCVQCVSFKITSLSFPSLHPSIT